MIIYNEKFQVETGHAHVTVLDVTKQVREIVEKSKVKNGNILVYTGHTSCSVQIQEFSDGQTLWLFLLNHWILHLRQTPRFH